MQWVGGRTHAAFPMGDASRVGEARRHAATLAAGASLDETAAGRLAIVVTELGNNLVRHATGGRLLLAADEAAGEVEVISIDSGPGMSNVTRNMGDGFSTGGTPGTGLGAVRRLSQDFDLHSVAGEGTAIVARVRAHDAPPPPVLRVTAISIAAPGEVQCGDGWGGWVTATAATLLVADGLGHGGPAAEASREALETVREGAGSTPATLMLEDMHGRLRTTRGAAVFLMRLDAAAETVAWCGAGNVMARLVSGVSDRTLVTQHGTVGMQMRRVEESTVPWPPHAIVIVHSDGLESRWPPQRIVPLLARDPALVAAILLRDHTRGRDDVTVLVARRKD